MSATQPQRPESGLRNYRIDFAREDNFGRLPTEASFKAFGDVLNAFSWPSGATLEARRGLSDADPLEHLRGPESHELTVGYDLCKFFVQNGNPEDAAYDGLARTADNLLPNSHTVVGREDKGEISASATVENRVNGSGNATSRETRLFSVGQGGLINEATLSGDPSDSQPVSSELGYNFQKVRSYQVDQPDGETLAVVSTDAADTGQTVVLESEDGATSEELTLNGTTVVSGTSTFSDLDAVHVKGDLTGNLHVQTDTNAEILTRVFGSAAYDGVEPDHGIPALETNGSREDPASLPSVETFLGDRVLRAGSPVPWEVPSATLTVSNNIETQVRGSGLGMALYPGNRNISLEQTVYGETATHALLVDHLQNNSKTYTWELDGGDVEIQNAALTEPGERAPESGQAVMTTENGFEGTGITFTEA